MAFKFGLLIRKLSFCVMIWFLIFGFVRWLLKNKSNDDDVFRSKFCAEFVFDPQIEHISRRTSILQYNSAFYGLSLHTNNIENCINLLMWSQFYKGTVWGKLAYFKAQIRNTVFHALRTPFFGIRAFFKNAIRLVLVLGRREGAKSCRKQKWEQYAQAY